MRIGITLVAMVAVMSSSAANAQVRDFGSAGGFDVFGQGASRDEPGLCVFQNEYEGPGATKISVSLRSDSDHRDLALMSVKNMEWSAEAGKDYRVAYHFDDGTYERTALGSVDGVYRGFTAFFPADEFLSTIAASQSVQFDLDGQKIRRLSLSGSAAGISLLRKCWSWVMSTERAAEAERNRYKDIPRDPFKAPARPATQSSTTKATDPRSDTLPDGLEGG